MRSCAFEHEKVPGRVFDVVHHLHNELDMGLPVSNVLLAGDWDPYKPGKGIDMYLWDVRSATSRGTASAGSGSSS